MGQLELLLALLLWLACSLVRLRELEPVLLSPDVVAATAAALHLAADAFIGAVLVALIFCVLFVCHALTLMIDTFCVNILSRQDLSEAVRDWSVLEAILRKVSDAIEYLFF